MHTFRKLAVLLLLFALLAPLAASAAGSKAGAARKPAKTERAPATLGSLVWALAFGIWTKEGMGIDPHGSPTSAPVNSLDAGCDIDPSGRCHS